MAIVKTEGLVSQAQLVAWMQENLVPNFFQSVEVDSENNLLIVCTGVGGQKLLGIKIRSESSFYPENFILYKSDGTEVTLSPSSTSYTPQFRYAAICKNGAIIAFSRYNDNNSTANSSAHLLITKNNLDKTAVIATGTGYSSNVTGADYKARNLYTIAEDDNHVLTTLSFTLRQMQQAQFVQFETCPESGVISFTPNAYYMQSCDFYATTFTTVTVDGVDYMTNGYWAIKDE